MGPLVPDIIGNELNLIVAFFIGIAFGFVLEQAGFSTSKKLVGLFYGYDFTVLRVFFTAGVTAMTGVIIMGHYGLLDLSLIYINPTFLYSAVLGGLIMGLGFVIGGYCPGTSLCAAAIGKIDAMVFIAGSFLGVLIFAEGYPWIEWLYKAENWGDPTIFGILGLSQGVFAFLLMAVAVGAFYFVTVVENRVNHRKQSEFRPAYRYHLAAAAAVVIGFILIFMPEKKNYMLADAAAAGFTAGYTPHYITSDELAFRILDNDPAVQLIDFRNALEYKRFSLPGALNLKTENLFEKETGKLLHVRNVKRVFYSYDERESVKAAKLADELGYKNIYVLQGGLKEFSASILNFKRPDGVISRQQSDTYNFRERARAELPALIEKSKAAKVEKKQAKRIIGGC